MFPLIFSFLSYFHHFYFPPISTFLFTSFYFSCIQSHFVLRCHFSFSQKGVILPSREYCVHYVTHICMLAIKKCKRHVSWNILYLKLTKKILYLNSIKIKILRIIIDKNPILFNRSRTTLQRFFLFNLSSTTKD